MGELFYIGWSERALFLYIYKKRYLNKALSGEKKKKKAIQMCEKSIPNRENNKQE